MKKSLIALLFASFLITGEVQSNNTNTTPSACQMPHCLPVLTSYLQIQASLLQSVKQDLETTKQQVHQVTGQWPPGNYCILANGSCPSGFTRSAGHLRGLRLPSNSHHFITPATFGDSKISKIQRGGNCPYNYGQDIGELYITACCK